MEQTDFAKNQNQARKQAMPALVWIAASIIFHLLILLLIMTYKFNMFEQILPQALRQDDKVILWTNQPQPAPTQQPIPAQNEEKKSIKLEPEPKKEVKEPTKPEQKAQVPATTQETPIILPGKKGIDKQDLEGILSSMHDQKNNANLSKKVPSPEQKDLRTDSAQKAPINQPLYTTTPLAPPRSTQFIRDVPKQITDQSSNNQQNEFNGSYQHVPKSKKTIPIKAMSFKDLGIGSRKDSPTFGNSENVTWYGNSLHAADKNSVMRWTNYAKTVHKLITNSISFHPQLKLAPPQAVRERLCVSIKINRNGQVLEAYMIIPSKNPIINHIILDSIKRVGLFNSFSKFTKEDVWECNMYL